jgi:hypothetical protein
MIVRLLLQLLAVFKSILAHVVAIEAKQTQQDAILQRILDAVTNDPAVSVCFNVEIEGQIHLGVSNVTIKDNQKFTASVVFLDAKGKVAAVDGAPVWTGSNDVAFTVTPSEDGLSAEVVANDLGTGQVSVSADADLGAGVTTITGTLDLEVIAGDAVTVQINTAPPTDQ